MDGVDAGLTALEAFPGRTGRFLLGAYRGFVVTAAPLWFEQLGLFCFSLS